MRNDTYALPVSALAAPRVSSRDENTYYYATDLVKWTDESGRTVPPTSEQYSERARAVFSELERLRSLLVKGTDTPVDWRAPSEVSLKTIDLAVDALSEEAQPFQGLRVCVDRPAEVRAWCKNSRANKAATWYFEGSLTKVTWIFFPDANHVVVRKHYFDAKGPAATEEAVLFRGSLVRWVDRSGARVGRLDPNFGWQQIEIQDSLKVLQQRLESAGLSIEK
jgi:hypothetical protein